MKAVPQPRPAILVIESDKATRSGMQSLLEKYGYRVSVAVHEKAAAISASQQKFDLILFDSGLAPPESLVAAYKLTQQPELNNVPMMVMSVHSNFSVPLDSPDIDNFTVAYLSNISRFDELEKLIRCLMSES